MHSSSVKVDLQGIAAAVLPAGTGSRVQAMQIGYSALYLIPLHHVPPLGI